MSRPRRILLSVADAAFEHILAEQVRSGGHSVAPPGEHDLAIADEACGEQAVRDLKKLGPVILLGGARSWGADRVIAKPLRLGVLMAAIADVAAKGARSVRIGPWDFDATSRTLTGGDGTSKRLTDKEAAILAMLAADAGTVPRERLLAEIWGYAADIDTHTLETHIYRLRRKLGAGDEMLVTESGGYRLAR